MRPLNLFIAGAVVIALGATTASAQIVVLREGEKAVKREQRYGYCWLTVGEVNYVSGIIYLPQDDIRDIFLKAYEAYGRANLGSIRDTFCRDDFTYSGGADDDIKRWITNNPRVRFERNGWTGSFRTAGQPTSPRRPVSKPPTKASESGPVSQPVPKGPTPNQIKYQRELAAHQERLAEIERIKAETAAKLARDKAAAQQVIDRHRQDMDVNRQQVAASDRAKRQYEQELAAHEAQTKQLRTKQDRDALADWPEAVTVCELNAQNPQAKFGNWRCEGPLQMDYAKLGNGGQVDPKALFNVSNACGGKVESVRDLGTVAGYRVFGCSYGMHPNVAQRLSNDAAAKFGLSYIPGRITYRCPTWQSGCRVR